MKYGGYTEMETLALMGIVFLAHAETGCDYHEAVISACGARFAEVDAIEGRPVCAMKENGRPDREGMKPVRRYFKVKRMADRTFEQIRKKNST